MKIFCVGMNYPEHNKELKDTLLKADNPVIFLKADSSLQKNGKPFFIPDDLGCASWARPCPRASPTAITTR